MRRLLHVSIKKKYLLIGVALVLLCAAGLAVALRMSSRSTQMLAAPQKVTTSRTTPGSQPATKPVSPPVAVTAAWGNITIPAINVSSPLEAVGLDAQKRMAIPAKDDDAGWYKLGHKPSEAGNTVVDGHVSLTGGRHGVFYNLSKLKAGDSIVITDNQQKQYRYVVSDSVSYGRDSFPLQDVFDGQHAKQLLKLITCESYDSIQKTYSDRRVVTARLSTP